MMRQLQFPDPSSSPRGQAEWFFWHSRWELRKLGTAVGKNSPLHLRNSGKKCWKIALSRGRGGAGGILLAHVSVYHITCLAWELRKKQKQKKTRPGACVHYSTPRLLPKFLHCFFAKVVENARFTWGVWAQDDISVKRAVRVARHRNCRPLTSHKKSNGNNAFNLRWASNEKICIWSLEYLTLKVFPWAVCSFC